MALSAKLQERAKSIEGVGQFAYRAVAAALEVIPRTLAQNCGMNVIRVMTDLRSKHAQGQTRFGVEGNSGKVADVIEAGIFDSFSVKIQSLRASIESSAMILRIDDIVSGLSGKKEQARGGEEDEKQDTQETFGDARDG